MEKLKSGSMTGREFQMLLICAQADEAVEQQRQRERERR